MDKHPSISEQLESLSERLSEYFPIPVALFKFFYSIASFFLGVLFIPPRVAFYIVTNYPMITLFLAGAFFVMAWLLRRLAQVDIINYILYTVIPYGLSIFYTVLTMFFPQLHTFSTIGNALLHPFAWLLGMVEKVDQRAAPIRRTVEAMVDARDEHRSASRGRRGDSGTPQPTRRSSRLSERIETEARRNDERTTCCVCLNRDKSVLLQPCNHLCLCEACVGSVKKTNLCPICRTHIDNYLNVFI